MKHKTIEECDTVNGICKPLFSNTEITYFSHAYFKNSGEYKFTCTSTSPEFLEIYFDNRYYNNDIHLLDIDKRSRYIYWDMLERVGRSKEMHDRLEALDIGHTYTIIEHGDGYKNCYNFAANLNNTNINNKYLSYTEILEKFILYYKEVINTDKNLQAIYKQFFTIDNTYSGYYIKQPCKPENLQNINDQFKMKTFMLGHLGIKLSLREIECLRWLSYGKTMEQIGEILNITSRTVKAHIESCKQKLQCYNLFQLGAAYNDLNLDCIFK